VDGSILGRGKIFFVCFHSVQSVSGAHPTDIGALSLLRHAINHSPNTETTVFYTFWLL
jgi:hypothetical protein